MGLGRILKASLLAALAVVAKLSGTSAAGNPTEDSSPHLRGGRALQASGSNHTNNSSDSQSSGGVPVFVWVLGGILLCFGTCAAICKKIAGKSDGEVTPMPERVYKTRPVVILYQTPRLPPDAPAAPATLSNAAPRLGSMRRFSPLNEEEVPETARGKAAPSRPTPETARVHDGAAPSKSFRARGGKKVTPLAPIDEDKKSQLS